MIHTVTLNPALDRTVTVPYLTAGAVNRITSVRTDPGGKGLNVSRAVLALGGRSLTWLLTAGDPGERLIRLAESAGLDCRSVDMPGETRMNTKIIDPQSGLNTDLNEPGPVWDPEALARLQADLCGDLVPGDLVILSGSLPKNAPAGTYADLVSACADAGAEVWLDTDGEPLRLALEARPALIKPNDTELGRLLGRKIRTPEEAAAGARDLLALGIDRVVVSLGQNGALFADSSQVLHIPGLKVSVRSTVGAGDTMVAALAWASRCGMDPEAAARLAVAASAAACTTSGTQPPDLDEVDRLLEQTGPVFLS